MARSTIVCPTIVIQNGGINSNIVQYNLIHEDADSILLMANSVDAAPTYKIQINEQYDGGGSWEDFTDGTNNILAPGSGKSAIYPFLNFTFRIVASQAVGQQCIWKMFKSVTVLFH